MKHPSFGNIEKKDSFVFNHLVLRYDILWLTNYKEAPPMCYSTVQENKNMQDNMDLHDKGNYYWHAKK